MNPKILVAYDFGTASDAALDWAADLHASVGGPPIHVLHVVNPIPPVAPEMAVAAPGEQELAQLRARLEEQIARRRIDATADVLLDPFAAGAVVKKARHFEANLIVMGTHGRSPLLRAFLGSVAHHVVQHASCPVVTVHAPEAAVRAHAA